MMPEPWRVRSVVRESADVYTLGLESLSSPVPPFLPGQFNMLYAFGVGEVPISLSGDAADVSGFVHTIRAVGAVSTALSQAQPDSVLGLRGPFGCGWPLTEASGHDILIVAGGLGLAPLRPVIYHLLAHSEHFGRITILHGSRSPAEILFRSELAMWQTRPDVSVAITVDHADPTWHGHVGVVPALVERAVFDPPGTIAFVCGPEVMMRFSAAALLAAGVGANRIHVSMERNMKCAIGLCGHCQFGADFVCRDGPVLPYDRIAKRLAVPEL